MAGSGLAVDAAVLVKPTNFFVLGASFIHQANPFSAHTLEEGYTSAYPGVEFRCTAGDWRLSGLMANIMISLAPEQIPGLSFDLELKGGFPKYHFPRIVITAEYQGAIETITQEADPTRAGTFGAGFGLSYRFNQRWALTAGVSYVQGNPSFSTVTTSNFGPSAYYGYDQKVTSVNLCGGLRFIIVRPK